MYESVLRLGPLDDLRVSVGRQPLPTVLSLLADALGTVVQGVPSDWRTAARKACPAAAMRVLRPACESGRLWLPTCLSPLPLDSDGVPEQLERMAALAPYRLAGDLAEQFPTGIPPKWQRVLDCSEPFVRAYIEAMTRIWSAFAPVWQRSRHLLELEAERIGIASVTGTLEAALACLGPRVSRTADGLRLPGGRTQILDVRERRLQLVPLVSGSRACVVGLGRTGSPWIGYPVPGLRKLMSDVTLTDSRTSGPLEAVLGGMRALVLRHAHRGLTMGEISALLRCAPGAATHHCKQLEAAGLVRRKRQGQQVRLVLTQRGERLLGVLTA